MLLLQQIFLPFLCPFCVLFILSMKGEWARLAPPRAENRYSVFCSGCEPGTGPVTFDNNCNTLYTYIYLLYLLHVHCTRTRTNKCVRGVRIIAFAFCIIYIIFYLCCKICRNKMLAVSFNIFSQFFLRYSLN